MSPCREVVTFTWGRGNHSCHPKPLKHTPLFPETISCLAWITSESGKSGHDTGLDASAKLALFFAISRTIFGEQSDGIPESRSRLIMGDSWIQCCRGAAVLLFGQLFSMLRRLSSAQAPRSLGAVLEGSGHLCDRLPQ